MLLRLSLACLLATLSFVACPAQGISAPGASVTFSQRPARVGDQAELAMTVDLQLETTARNGQQVIDQSSTQLHREQQRVMTTTQLATKPDGSKGPSAARVEYRKSSRADAGGDPATEPVEGNAYFCKRDGEKLRVVTPEGDLPPLDEFSIVAQNMETLGRDNPLAKFFAGRTVKVGETIAVPNELASQLLGMQDQFGKAKRFTLTLREVKTIDSQPCALFQTEIEAGSQQTAGKGPQMGISVSGTLVLQINACRAVEAKLAGPIGMSESRNSGGNNVQVTGLGNLRVAIRTKYRDAR